MKIPLLLVLLDACARLSAKTVADFGLVTWNADSSPNWNAAKHYFLQANVDLMAIQQASQLPHWDVGLRAVPRNEAVPTRHLGGGAAKPTFDVQEYRWNLTDHDRIYLYYYIPAAHSDGRPNGSCNLAVLSRHKAHKLFVLPAAEGDTANPALMGLRIESALFFNVHSPRDAAALVNRIANVAAAHYPTLTWALIGDFDATPATLAEGLARWPAPTDTFRRVVATGAATRVPRPWDMRSTVAFSKVSGRRYRRKHQNCEHQNSKHQNSQYQNSKHQNSQHQNSQHQNSKHQNSQHQNSQHQNSKHQNSKYQNSKHHQEDLPGTQLQTNGSHETSLLLAVAPFRTVGRRQLRAAPRRRSGRNRKAAAPREVDYAVFGGPSSSRHIMKSVNVELLKNYFARVHVARYLRNPSHHLPLIFNKRL